MRSLSVGMQAHLAGTAHSRARMVLLELQDGAVIGLTTHDRPLLYDLGQGHGEIEHSPRLGGTLSSIAQSIGLEAGNCEIRGPISTTITRAGILGGRFDDAKAWVFQLNWKRLRDGHIPIMRGFATQLRVEGGEWVGEIQDYRAKLNQAILNVITPTCRLDFAGVDCGAAATEVVGTVTVSTDAMHMTLAFAGAYADNFFNKGKLIGLTGANAGVVRKIERWHATGAVELFDPFPDLADLGDTFTIRDGCSKLRFSPDATIPTCKSRNNVVRMRAYPDGPGSERIMRPAIPGEGSQ